MGKHKPVFMSHNDCGDYVVVTNAAGLHFTGDKMKQKSYYSHSGYPGSLKRLSAEQMMDRAPEKVLMKAVRGMLPKNRLRNDRMARLKVFAGNKHPYVQNIGRSYEKMPQREFDLSSLYEP